MAGLDTKRQSDFITMLQEVSGESARVESLSQHMDPVELCTHTIRTIQMVSEALLLRDRDLPLSEQTFTGCCETLIAKSKGLSVAVANISQFLKLSTPQKICAPLGEMAETLAVMVEATAQSVFMLGEHNSTCSKAIPGIVDSYPLARARLAVSVSTSMFKKANISAKEVMAVSAVIATHLEALRLECERASTIAKDAFLQTQLKACSRGLSGSTAMLVAAIKEYVSKPNEYNRKKLNIFVPPLTTSIDALLTFVHSDPSFFGTPPKLSKEVNEYVKPIQGAALSLISATCLYLGASKSLLVAPTDAKAAKSLDLYASAIDDAVSQLTTAVKEARKADLVKMERATLPKP